jgi:outer membrane protein assembly factor BamB
VELIVSRCVFLVVWALDSDSSHVVNAGQILAAAVMLPDGESLAYASTSGTIVAVNATTGARLWTLDGFGAIASDLVLSPSGEELIFVESSGVLYSVTLNSKQTAWTYQLIGVCVVALR